MLLGPAAAAWGGVCGSRLAFGSLRRLTSHAASTSTNQRELNPELLHLPP